MATGVFIEHHEHGPDFQVEPDSLAAGYEVATRWLREIQKATPAEVSVSLDVPEAPGEQANLRLVLPPGGAAALAGPLAGQPAVWMGAPADAPVVPVWRGGRSAGQVRSLAELAERGGRERVESGPVLVRLDLPWGSWSNLVRAPLAGEAVVELPAALGQPPLRVGLHAELGRLETALLGIAGEAPEGRLRRGLYAAETSPLVALEAGTGAWALRPAPGLLNGEIGIAELAAGGFNLALLGGRTLAVDLSRGGLRVEPLSSLDSPAWDLLVALGRLDALSAQEALALSQGKWEDWLLGLAGAYAFFARPADRPRSYLDMMLRHLGRFQHSAPDLDLLRIAWRARGKEPAEKELRRLRPWAEAGSIPLLRWGVPLALRLLAKTGDPSLVRWREALAEVSRRLSPISTWTAWTGSSEGSA